MVLQVTTAILITARLKSTRLKKKVLKPILGRPMLSYMIERLRLAKYSEKIILCTSTVEEDDPLALFAKNEGIECFRGHPDDVLLRMSMAADKYGVNTVVSCTADNPFVDPVYIDKLVDFHLAKGSDFSRSEGMPFGTFAYALQHQAIKKACQIKNQVDTEVWGGYFTETGLFKCDVLYVTDPAIRWPELRLTVDMQEDFDLVTEIFKLLYKEGEVFTLKEIISLSRQRPGLTSINAHVQQAKALSIQLKK